MNKQRKGQMWTMDFIIGLMLFIIILLLTVKLTFNMYPSEEHITVYRDAVHLSDALVSPGYPLAWNASNALLPGISTNNRIDTTKLAQYPYIEYGKAKTLFHITSDYIFFIQNNTNIINTGQCVYGYNISTDANCTPLLATLEYDNLAKIDRMVLYNSTVVILTIYTWN